MAEEPKMSEVELLRLAVQASGAEVRKLQLQFEGACYAHALLLEDQSNLMRVLGADLVNQTPKEVQRLAVALREVANAASKMVTPGWSKGDALYLVAAIQDLKKVENKT